MPISGLWMWFSCLCLFMFVLLEFLWDSVWKLNSLLLEFCCLNAELLMQLYGCLCVSMCVIRTKCAVSPLQGDAPNVWPAEIIRPKTAKSALSVIKRLNNICRTRAFLMMQLNSNPYIYTRVYLHIDLCMNLCIYKTTSVEWGGACYHGKMHETQHVKRLAALILVECETKTAAAAESEAPPNVSPSTPTPSIVAYSLTSKMTTQDIS